MQITNSLLTAKAYGTLNDVEFHKHFKITPLEMYTLTLSKRGNIWFTGVISGNHPDSITMKFPLLVNRQITSIEELNEIEELIERKVMDLV